MKKLKLNSLCLEKLEEKKAAKIIGGGAAAEWCSCGCTGSNPDACIDLGNSSYKSTNKTLQFE